MALTVGSQVRVAYDFDGEESNEELTVKEGDILTIRFTDVGEGWIQAENQSGKSGLVPEAYVEAMSAAVPSVPNPTPANTMGGFNDDDWGNVFGTATSNTTSSNAPTSDPFGASSGGFGNSDFSSDPFGSSFQPTNQSSANSDPFSATPQQPARPDTSNSFKDDHTDTMDTVTDSFQDSTLSGPTKKGGIFGGKNKVNDPFFIGPSPGPSMDENVPQVAQESGIVRWKGNHTPFTLTVGNPEKSSKLGGMKTFIQYQITPSNNSRAVLRRYKHFDWLHEQLTRKYAAVCIIPPLPGKQVTGRYEDDFVSDRMSRLQCWGSRMCKHPLMSHDEKLWKGGKRTAEKDQVVGELFSLQLSVPEESMDSTKHQVWLQERTRHNKQMSEVMNQFYSVGAGLQAKLGTSCKKDYEKLGQAAAALAEATDFDQSEGNQKLLKALRSFSGEMKVVGESVCNAENWIPLNEGLLEYRGLLHAKPQLLNTNISVMNRLDELRKAQISQKISSEQLQEAKRRAETLSYAVRAEIQHFDAERTRDMSEFLANFLKLQISAHQKALASLQGALQGMVEIYGTEPGDTLENLHAELEVRKQNAKLLS